MTNEERARIRDGLDRAVTSLREAAPLYPSPGMLDVLAIGLAVQDLRDRLDKLDPPPRRPLDEWPETGGRRVR